MKMVKHFVWMAGIITLVALCIFYPFFPGEYDGLAVTLSAMSQLLGIVGLLLVPIGIAGLFNRSLVASPIALFIAGLATLVILFIASRAIRLRDVFGSMVED